MVSGGTGASYNLTISESVPLLSTVPIPSSAPVLESPRLTISRLSHRTAIYRSLPPPSRTEPRTTVLRSGDSVKTRPADTFRFARPKRRTRGEEQARQKGVIQLNAMVRSRLPFSTDGSCSSEFLFGSFPRTRTAWNRFESPRKTKGLSSGYILLPERYVSTEREHIVRGFGRSDKSRYLIRSTSLPNTTRYCEPDEKSSDSQQCARLVTRSVEPLNPIGFVSAQSRAVYRQKLCKNMNKVSHFNDLILATQPQLSFGKVLRTH